MMLEIIRADARRYLSIDGWDKSSVVSCLFVLFFSYGFHATVVYRYGRSIEVLRSRFFTLPLYWFLNFIYSIFYWLSKRLYGIDISREAEIGEGFYIGHFGGVKVPRCRIGEICNIHQLTVLGVDTDVGSYVWIGAHAVIEGGIVIEDHATVTVAAKVSQRVASYSLVAGNPARPIKVNFDNSQMLGMKQL